MIMIAKINDNCDANHDDGNYNDDNDTDNINASDNNSNMIAIREVMIINDNYNVENLFEKD